MIICAAGSPETNGYELCRAIKADEGLKDTPVILLTSLSDKTDIIRGVECGADNFVTKPVDERQLVATIENLLSKRELSRTGGGARLKTEVVLDSEKYSVPSEREQVVDLLISAYETAVQKSLELQQARKELDGLNRKFEERVRGRTGEISKELIEYKAAESALKEQQKSLRQMIDANPNIIFVKDEEGRFLQANQAMARIYGISAESLIGKTAADFIDAEEAGRVAELDAEVLSTLQSKFIPEERVTNSKTGETHWLQTIKKPLLSSDGRIRQLLCVATDITERKRAEEALRKSEERFRAIVSQTSAGIAEVDLTGKFTFVNDWYAEIVGYAPGELLGGMGLQNITHLEDLRDNYHLFEKCVTEGMPFVVEKRYVRRDQSVIWVNNSVSVVRDADGRPSSVLAVTLDIAERMGGVEASQRIRALGGENVPLIFMTGYSFEIIQTRFFNENATIENIGTPLIQKPSSFQNLGRRVREVLDANPRPVGR